MRIAFGANVPYILSMYGDLYHGRVLELAAETPHVGRLAEPDGTATKVSRICGSVVTVDLKLKDGLISEVGVEPKACALGQAAASVLTGNIVGATPQEVLEARDALRRMLKEEGAPPAGRFWELRHLEAVREFPPRHLSTMLAFEAAVAALEMAGALPASAHSQASR